jgi:hypothetical protein
VSSQSANHNALGAGPHAAMRMDLSGHERDKMFLSRGAKDVIDVSYLSGADGIEDARAFAKADLDRDGYEDLIVVDRNAPLLRVYRNQLGPATKHGFVGIRLEGKRQRDAVGARLRARACGVTQTREIALGSGFATVNAMTVTLGLGECTQIDELTVRFGSGEQRTFSKLPAGAFYRVVEGKGIQSVAGVYDRPRTSVRSHASSDRDATPRLARLAASAPGRAPLVLIDLFATWCDACARTAPQLEAMTAGKLDLVGVTIEPNDDAAAVERYRTAHPTGHPLFPFDEGLAAEVMALFATSPPLPSVLVLDRKTGVVLLQTRGLPTRSEVERALWTPQP